VARAKTKSCPCDINNLKILMIEYIHDGIKCMKGFFKLIPYHEKHGQDSVLAHGTRHSSVSLVSAKATAPSTCKNFFQVPKNGIGWHGPRRSLARVTLTI
jgi:hypothetical protein